MTTTVRPRNPAELAVLLPYQLGYHPGPSVVLTVLRGRTLGMLQRHDLPEETAQCRPLAERAVEIARREGATGVLLLAYEAGAGDSAALRGAMVEAAAAVELTVQEHVVVRDGRWYAPDCRRPCCPEEGLPLPRPEDVPAVAAFVHAGVAPLPSREALVAGALPGRDEERAREVGLHLAALGRGPTTDTFGGYATRSSRAWLLRADETLDWWAEVLDPGPAAAPVADLPDVALAGLASSLQDVHWRDLLMWMLCPGTAPLPGVEPLGLELAFLATQRCPWTGLEEDGAGLGPGDCPEDVVAVRSRLVDLVRLLPEHASPPVLTLVAQVAWWSGDGTVAGICLERALEIDPDYRLAGLMLQLLSVGLRPWEAPGPGAAEAA